MAGGFRTIYRITSLDELICTRCIRTQPTYTGRVTVPILWDCTAHKIVNNESSEIIRIINGPLAQLGHGEIDLYPTQHRDEIDGLNALIYPNVNNGVYRAGFATAQEAYEDAVRALFDTLDLLESRLARQHFLVGDQLTEADVRLFTTLIRFDGSITPTLSATSSICWIIQISVSICDAFTICPASLTCHIDHVKTHYFGSHPTINPSGIIPGTSELATR